MSASTKVYVANIPYDVKEDALRRILERAGPIVNFDLLKKDSGHLDREHSGVGWCTYGTAADAQNAIRLLNGFHVNGRALRVAPSEKRRGPQSGHERSGKSGGGSGEPAFEIVKRLSPEERWDILSQFQGFMSRRPRQARELLVEEPQIAQALTLINQFVRSGRQQNLNSGGAPLPAGAPHGVNMQPGGNGMPPNFQPNGPGPALQGGPPGGMPRAPQFILNSGGRPGGRQPPSGSAPRGFMGGPMRGPDSMGGMYGGHQGNFGGVGQNSGAPVPRFYAGAGSGSGVVQTISRGKALSSSSSAGASARGRPRGGKTNSNSRGSSGAPSNKRARRPDSKKKAVDDLL
eukprot:INCI2673.6.p1 GENE.INCI2673.6~~INCI2673.6.p1  ORF type:complete len:346 (-),score=51.43 INCI2673.6:124-1161(-)